MEENIVPFNPLDKRNLGRSVAQEMLRRPAIPISELSRFKGAGIYALYYSGDFPCYKPIAKKNAGDSLVAPIYVGKSVPKGSRIGGDLESPPGTVLYSRLVQHRRSIEEAENLAVEDFTCRFLVVEDIWIPLGEALLIAMCTPLWNNLLHGFGNHDPGRGRHAGERSRWDVLHPGRPWADKLQSRDESAVQLEREMSDFLRNNPPPDSLQV